MKITQRINGVSPIKSRIPEAWWLFYCWSEKLVKYHDQRWGPQRSTAQYTAQAQRIQRVSRHDCIELCLDRNICKMRDVCSFIALRTR
ncbi:hypothetical protein CUMW_099670 [Citrus unshiu]|nr:hypothetical protein CUMW_099670 [Citrus unshiu]GAY46781.1 hypothetical protein CUMW_099670 [Citrus unshiu]GAY46782.1 hypothetical protein CUMW_099670 [Citrus unshiu]GAY46783.1 hypothetical protein CUMW_099670 [Citrus unshiu]